jgi:hypothetical protein
MAASIAALSSAPDSLAAQRASTGRISFARTGIGSGSLGPSAEQKRIHALERAASADGTFCTRATSGVVE